LGINLHTKSKIRKKKRWNSIYNIRVICNVPQAGHTRPQFRQNWGQNEKSGWKWYTRQKLKNRKKKERIKLVFSPKLVLAGVSTLVLHSPYLCFQCTSYFLGWINSCLNKTNPTTLVNWYPVLLTLQLLHSNWG
jgi:hypothetical protein